MFLVRLNDRAGDAARKDLSDPVLRGCDNDFRSVIERLLDVFEFGFRAVRALAARAFAKRLIIFDVFDKLFDILSADQGNEGGFIFAVRIDTLGRSQNQKGLRFHQASDLTRRLVVIHALDDVRRFEFQIADFEVALLFAADRVVIFDDGDRALLFRAGSLKC